MKVLLVFAPSVNKDEFTFFYYLIITSIVKYQRIGPGKKVRDARV